ncbi:MAG TPA: hypothetical protein VHV51_20445 [Polyangiaceae bacterium]|jgi:hypothetical protein|nr:hypothetical protein [Polyangiaceae bacterium]
MAKLTLRATSACVLCAAWIYACGGSSFSASGGGGSSGSTASGGDTSLGGSASPGGSSASGSAGDASGGTSSAGTAQGGSSTIGEGGAVGEAGASTGGSVGAAGAGGVRNSGDCLAAKDCPTGNKCVALYPGGFRTCVVPVEPPVCTASDACCPGTTDCAAGSSCVETPIGPSCGGLLTKPTIECVKEACTVAADCTGNNAICVPAGALDRKVSTCLSGGCRLDTDCKDEAGGKCEPVTPNCCNGPSGLYCVYPSKGCRSDADCATGSTCQIESQKTGQCVTGAGVCAG